MTIFKRFHASQDWRAPMPPLHWRPVLDHVAEGFEPSRHPGKVLAIVSCRNGHSCAIRVGMGSNFTISAAGIVQPSIGCPVEGCGGHEPQGSTLEGWAAN